SRDGPRAPAPGLARHGRPRVPGDARPDRRRPPGPGPPDHQPHHARRGARGARRDGRQLPARRDDHRTGVTMETINVSRDGAVLFAELDAPPMTLLGPALVRDLVSLIERAEADEEARVLVFTSADPDYFIPHVDVGKIPEYRAEAAKLTGEPSI